jgi:hypothetical protein
MVSGTKASASIPQTVLKHLLLAKFCAAGLSRKYLAPFTQPQAKHLCYVQSKVISHYPMKTSKRRDLGANARVQIFRNKSDVENVCVCHISAQTSSSHCVIDTALETLLTCRITSTHLLRKRTQALPRYLLHQRGLPHEDILLDHLI